LKECVSNCKQIKYTEEKGACVRKDSTWKTADRKKVEIQATDKVAEGKKICDSDTACYAF